MRLLRGALDQVGPLLAQAEAALDARTPAEAAALQAECLALRANLLQAGGRAAEAIAAAERSLALTAATDHRLIGLASLALGGAYRQTPDFERAVAALQRASQAAQAAGDRVTDMLAVAHLTLMATQYGRLRLAAEAGTEALQRLARENAAPPPIIGAVYGALGLIHFELRLLGSRLVTSCLYAVKGQNYEDNNSISPGQACSRIATPGARQRGDLGVARR
jgi:LuxR family maltose regulon positive regulatory protein